MDEEILFTGEAKDRAGVGEGGGAGFFKMDVFSRAQRKEGVRRVIANLRLDGDHPRTGEELADNQAYTYRMLDSVKSLDPQLISSVEDSDVARGLFEGLFNEDGDGNLVPAGAVSFDVSDDKLTYTFHLRQGVKFHDGTPVTAKESAVMSATCTYGWTIT